MIIRRVLRSMLFVSILGLLIVSGIRFVPLGGDYQPQKTFIDFKDDLLRSTESPKIVLFGGSNVFYGIDSELLKYKTGYNIVNMAINAGYRYKTYLNLLDSDLVKSGDIVILSFEYEDYNNALVYLYRFLRLYPEIVKYFEFPDDYSLNAFSKFISTLGVKYFEVLPKVLPASDSVNMYGDLLSSRLGKVPDCACYGVTLERSVFQSKLDLLNEFNSRMNKRGVGVVFSPPSFMDECFGDGEEEMVLDYYDFIRDNSEFFVAGTPERYFFDRSSVLDTVYHLDMYEKKVRTKKIVEDVSPFLDQDVLDKQLLFNEKVDFQKVSMALDVPKVVSVNESSVAELTVENEGFALMGYMGGYFLNIYDSMKDDILYSLRFGTDGNSDSYRLSGWSANEDSWNWTMGKEASLRIPLVDVNSDVLIECKISHVFPLKDNKPQIVEVYSDDVFVGSWEVLSPGNYEMVIPREYVADSGLVLNFKLPNAESALALGDPRVLAVAFESMKFNFPFVASKFATLEFEKDAELKTGDSYVFEFPIVAPDKPGMYEMSFEFHQMKNVILGGTVSKWIKVVR